MKKSNKTIKWINNKIKRVKTSNPQMLKYYIGIIWSVAGTIVSKMFVMLAGIITARILGADKNGIYGMIYSTVIMIASFVSLGLGITVMKFISEYKIHEKEKCGRIIGLTYIVATVLGGIITIALIMNSKIISQELLYNEELENYLNIASILLIINIMNTIQTNCLIGFERFKVIAQVTGIQGIISFPILIILTHYYDVYGMLVAQIIIGLFGTCVLMIVNNKARKQYDIKIDFVCSYKEKSLFIKFALPAIMANGLVGPITWFGNSLFVSIPDGYTQLGIFNAANLWRTMITFIPTAIGNVMIPMIISEKNNSKVEKLNVLLGLIIVIAFSIPLLVFPELLSYLYGRDYQGRDFTVALVLVVLVSIIWSYGDGISRKMISNNLMWWGLLSNSIWGIAYISFVILFKELGASGLALALLFAYIISIVVFVPINIYRRVVHKSLYISKELFIMWVTLFVLALFPLIGSPITIRIIFAFIAYLVLFRVFKLMVNNHPLN